MIVLVHIHILCMYDVAVDIAFPKNLEEDFEDNENGNKYGGFSKRILIMHLEK